MKKLSKLKINPEKLMKNEELLTLRGGYGGTYSCYKEGYTSACYKLLGTYNTTDCNAAWDICRTLYNGWCVIGPGC